MWWLVVVLAALAVGSYFLFRDTMNKIQYIAHLRLYWVTRDTGVPGDSFVRKAWMRQTAAPFWRGTGVEFRLRTHTFQVGILGSKGRDLQHQLSNLDEFDPQVEEIRRWVNEDT